MIKTYVRPAPAWRYLNDRLYGKVLAVTYWDEVQQNMVASSAIIPANWIVVQSETSEASL